MRELDLREYEPTGPCELSPAERDALLRHDFHLTLVPVAGATNEYTLTPGSTVGAVETEGLSVRIRPKIGIKQLLSLACYAIGKVRFQERELGFPEESALPDALAHAFTSAARMAFAHGLLHGYRAEESALLTVRGRIRIDRQIRRRFGVHLPIEVRYDEFTDDILPNRIVKAAAHRLSALRLRSQKARRGVTWVAGKLSEVSPVAYPPKEVPQVRFDRLNEHYRGVVTLARLVLRHGAFEASSGEVRATGFLMDMNEVFQQFVTVALRETLGVPEHVFRERSIDSLDDEGGVPLKPDLTWWEGGGCTFVGDAKYKRIDGGVPNADLYQLLAYATALGLPGGLLIYAEGEREHATHTVRHSRKRLEVATLDLSGTLEQALGRIGALAQRVEALHREADRSRPMRRIVSTAAVGLQRRA